MNSIEWEQLKENLATKAGVLKTNILAGTVSEDAMELVSLYHEYEHHGTTIVELQLLLDDILLALNDRVRPKEELIDLKKSRRELELEKIILQNKAEAIELRHLLENSIFVKHKAIEKVEKILTNSDQINKIV